jgi:transcriptional regulator with XRE-family HTH domain
MVGQRIKAYLEERGIKQSFLIDKTGLSAPKLTAIFAGTRKLDVMEYYKICEALEVDMNYFLKEG